MSCLAVSENIVAVTKGLHIDCYEHNQHSFYSVTPKTKQQEGDTIVDIVISSDDKLMGVITALSKELLLFELPLSLAPKSFALPRSASKIRFTTDNKQILVADKSGDALIYDLKSDDSKGDKILGHLSLLLDILQTQDNKFIITSDRDEKVKVSCYPNTYNIQTYCLGHKEFVNHIELLPHDVQYLLTTSGDGTVKLWNYTDGKHFHTIDSSCDVNDDHLRDSFIKTMDDDGIQVCTLPIVHFTATQSSEHNSILAVTIHTLNKILIYSLQCENGVSNHKLLQILPLKRFPAAVHFYGSSLYVYDDQESTVQVYKQNNEELFQTATEISMFQEKLPEAEQKGNRYESIKLLYKRKFDNVQEYQERKKQRLEKSKQ